jgi:hypothetical protein
VVSGHRHALAALPLRKDPQYPLDRRLDGSQSRSGQHGEEKILDPTGTQTLNPVIQPIIILIIELCIKKCKMHATV